MELKNYFKSLKVLHLSLVIGLSIFFIIALVQGNDFNTDINANRTLLYLVPVSALIGYFGSQFLFKKMLSSVQLSDSLETKLKKFQSASHIKYVIIEAPAFLALFVYYITGNALPLVIAGSLLAYLFVQKPSKEKVIQNLPFNAEEKQAITYK